MTRRPLTPSVHPPPVDRLRALDAERDELRDRLEASVRPQGQVFVPSDNAITVALRALLIADLAMGGWLIAVLSGSAPCAGPACTLATWGNPSILLVCAGICPVLVGGPAVVGCDVAEARGTPIVALLIGTACGVATASILIVALGLLLVALLIAAITVCSAIALAVQSAGGW